MRLDLSILQILNLLVSHEFNLWIYIVKLFLKVTAGVVVLIGVILGVVFYLTSNIAQVGDNFILALQEKDFSAAYQLLSQDFRDSTTESEFIEYIELHKFDRIEEASWSNRSISGAQGELAGVLITSTDAALPVKIGVVKESDSWLIYSIQQPRSGFIEGEGLNAPSREIQLGLVKEAFKVFALSVNAGDFTEYHKFISKLWRAQTTPDQLNQIFTVFIEREIDLLPLQNLEPVVEEVSFPNEDRLMMITGFFPTEPSLVQFELGYVYEGIGWRVAHTSIKIEASE